MREQAARRASGCWARRGIGRRRSDGNTIVIGDSLDGTAKSLVAARIRSLLTPAVHQLPRPPDDFVGRTKELGELRRAVLDGGMLVCGAWGSGGVGKTTLMLQLAHELAVDFPDAQIMVELLVLGSQRLNLRRDLLDPAGSRSTREPS